MPDFQAMVRSVAVPATASALAAVPQPRLLVSTPFHLSALLAAEIPLPEVDLLLSATAPLSGELAAKAEARTGAPLHEIYGSTETGQIAVRRRQQVRHQCARVRR